MGAVLGTCVSIVVWRALLLPYFALVPGVPALAPHWVLGVWTFLAGMGAMGIRQLLFPVDRRGRRLW